MATDPKVVLGRSRIDEDLSVRKQTMLLIDGPTLAEFNRGVASFENFIALEGNASRATSEIVSKSAVRDLMQLESEQISTLVPRVRLFKTFYQGLAGRGNQSRTDSVDVEFLIPDHISREDPHKIHSEGFTNNVGLKEFNYKFINGNPAEMYNVECEITLLFRSLSDIEREFVDPNSGHTLRYFDLLGLGTDKYTHKTTAFAIKAVVGWANNHFNHRHLPQDLARSIDSMSMTLLLNLKDHDLEVRSDGMTELTIGYVGTLDSVYLSPETDVLNDVSLEKQRQKLERIQKEINTREERVVDVETDTNEFINSELNTDINIRSELEKPISSGLKIGMIDSGVAGEAGFMNLARLEGFDVDSSTSALDLFKQAAEKGSGMQFLQTYLAPNDPSLIPAYTSVIREHLHVEVLESQKQQNERILTKLKAERYGRLLQGVIERGGVYYIDYPRENFGLTSESLITDEVQKVDISSDEEQRGVFLKLLENRRSSGGLSVDDIQVVPGTAIDGEEIRESTRDAVLVNSDDVEVQNEVVEGWDQAAQAWGSITKGEDEETSVERAANEGVKSSVTAGPASPVPEGKERVQFIFLGDIIDSALETLNQIASPLFARTRVMFGNIKVLSDEVPGGSYSINIADIPVSLDLFTLWFIDNIVKRDVDRYLFREFLRDLLNKLVPEALKGVDSNVVGRLFADYDFITFNLPEHNGRDMISAFANSRGRLTDSARPQLVRKIRSAEQNSFKTPRGYYSYLFITADTSGVSLFNDPFLDFEKGVYHLYQGSERGLVKNIKWSKVDDPLLQAANVRQNERLAKLRDFYDAEIEMVGNTLFYPGSIVFLNPVLLGLGNPLREGSSSRALGIGGYFLVLEVHSNLSAGGFHTTVKAKWHAFESKGLAEKLAAAPKDAAPGMPEVEVPDVEVPDVETPSLGGGLTDTVLGGAKQIATTAISPAAGAINFGVNTVKGLID